MDKTSVVILCIFALGCVNAAPADSNEDNGNRTLSKRSLFAVQSPGCKIKKI
jgi:hypothetical protein